MTAIALSPGGQTLRRLLRLLSLLFTGTLVSTAFSFAAQLMLARVSCRSILAGSLRCWPP